MRATDDCGIEYSRVYVGGINANSGKPGWASNVTYGIETNNVGAATSNRLTIHMNLISGPCNKGIYVSGTFDSVDFRQRLRERRRRLHPHGLGRPHQLPA